MCDAGNRLARRRAAPHRSGVKTWRGLAGIWVAVGVGMWMRAQPPEPSLPRPGAVLVLEVTGEAAEVTGEVSRPLKVDDRVRVGSTITTGRRSIATIALSNGAVLRIGSEAELEMEEFGQATVSGSLKFIDIKEEPTISRTRLRLVRGDVTVEVKRLNVARGSSFMLSMLAGTARTGEGTFHAMVRMSDLGLGVCTFEVEKGAAEFEITGGTFVPAPLGHQLAFAIELDKTSGAPKVSEMPKETPKTKG